MRFVGAVKIPIESILTAPSCRRLLQFLRVFQNRRVLNQGPCECGAEPCKAWRLLLTPTTRPAAAKGGSQEQGKAGQVGLWERSRLMGEKGPVSRIPGAGRIPTPAHGPWVASQTRVGPIPVRPSELLPWTCATGEPGQPPRETRAPAAGLRGPGASPRPPAVRAEPFCLLR